MKKIEHIGRYIVVILMTGVVVLSLSTILTGPLALFLTIAGGSALIVTAIVAQCIYMAKDIKVFFQDVDSHFE